MSRPCPVSARFPVAAILMGSSFFLIGSAAAVVVPADPLEIAFETTSPYYQPPVAIVSANRPVRWVNPTGSHHSVRHDGCLAEDICAFQSIAVPPDSSFIIAPLPPGRYGYHCELHPVMRGTLVVEDPRARVERRGASPEPPLQREAGDRLP